MESAVATAFYKGLLWLLGLIPAIFGSAFLIFNDRAEFANNSKWIPIITFIFGIVIGYNGGGAFCEWQDIEIGSFIAFTVQFSMGWMGIGILVQMRKNIPDWLDAIKTKYLG